MNFSAISVARAISIARRRFAVATAAAIHLTQSFFYSIKKWPFSYNILKGKTFLIIFKYFNKQVTFFTQILRASTETATAAAAC